MSELKVDDSAHIILGCCPIQMKTVGHVVKVIRFVPDKWLDCPNCPWNSPVMTIVYVELVATGKRGPIPISWLKKIEPDGTADTTETEKTITA